jgi:sister-chromatid-cohesion protein PDS5
LGVRGLDILLNNLHPSQYAPEAPWNESEVYNIFHQTIRQLANLAHTTSSSQAHYNNYARILELLAMVNIAVVLVDIAKDAGDGSDTVEDDENPTELLADLFRTVMQSLRTNHSPDVSDYALKILTGCLAEYTDGMPVPIPILDEILICLGTGPTITVTVAPKPQQASTKGGKRQPPLAPQKMEQTNPSYIVAASVIGKLTGKFHNDVSTLLNGLINNEPHVIERSSIAGDQEDEGHGVNQSGVDVWDIVYEINRISPAILTTVIGTISGCLNSPQVPKRQKVVRLLGRLFYAKESKLASKFSACFRKWLGRVVDFEWTIRKDLVFALTKIISTNSDKDVIEQSQDTLILLLGDKKLEIRLETISSVYEMVYEEQNEHVISPSLLHALGERVKSKDKKERQIALTGLVRIYYRHYMSKTLKDIQAAGDDCEIDLILNALSENCNSPGLRSKAGSTDAERDKYGWIPKRLAECFCYSDSFDTEMRGRVIKIVDEVILGSSMAKKGTAKSLSPTARAVGLAIILDSMRKDGESIWGDDNTCSNNALMHLTAFFRQRSNLQKGTVNFVVCCFPNSLLRFLSHSPILPMEHRFSLSTFSLLSCSALSNYIDARAKWKDSKAGTEEEYTADAWARGKLEILASLIPPPSGVPLSDVLDTVHAARDKHIFRVLASISDPKHGPAARSRALDELPKRTSSLGDPVQFWVRMLVHRCAMGDFVSAENIQHCILLAQESYSQGEVSWCVALLACVKFSVSVFPSICNDTQSFSTLTELFSEVQSAASGKGKANKEEKKLIQDSGIVTGLSSILSMISPTLKCAEITEEVSFHFLLGLAGGFLACFVANYIPYYDSP